MATPSIQAAVNAGELSPDLFGRVDLDKYRKGASTVRNFFSSYRGGVMSRGGTKFLGFCKQGQLGAAATALPPRNITFQFSNDQGYIIEAGEKYFRFIFDGGYVTEAPVAVTGATNSNPCVISTAPVAHGYSNGDEVFLSGLGGIINLNNVSYLVAAASATSFQLKDPLTGLLVDSTTMPAYTSGGLASRIYEIATPYAAADLPSLKWTQSADVVSFTHQSYQPYDLARISSTNWTLTKTTFSASIARPAATSAFQTNAGTTPSFYYQFVATAVDSVTGEESIASPVFVMKGVDAAIEAATAFIQCSPVAGAGSYNFYSGPVTYQIPPTPGGLFGYLGTSFGPTFNDTNVVPDFNTSPPLHTNPFATSSVVAVVMTAAGASYSTTATSASVISPIGKDPILLPIVSGGQIVWTSVQSGGEGLTGGEAVTFVDATGSGSGATATLDIGPATGTYPGVVAYFQQRRFYASTKNQPDTYFASQPGAFTNFDTSLPVKDDDALTGTPWSQQVNGIQWMINMPGGLVILTGLGAWQLSGGSFGAATANAVTPSNQVANPQAYNGVHPHVPPIVINYDILYVQAKGSIVRDLSYNFFVNIYTGTDLTVLSNHLFTNYEIQEWAWCEEPYKLVWVVRNDGTALSLTYLKEQEVYAWTRHDTNGQFVSVASVSEPPVNAPYFVVKRLIQNHGNPIWAYCQERMDNRLWKDLDRAWSVDCGLSYPLPTPNATLSLSSATGIPTLTPPVVVYGGSGYGASTYARLTDPTGSGALVTLTIVGGVVTGAAVSGTLTGYTDPEVTVVDPSGEGGNAVVTISSIHAAHAFASAPVFANVAGSGAPGDIIRMNGRVMEVVEFAGSTFVSVSILRDATPGLPDDPFDMALPAAPGEWSLAAPITVVHGLNHLEGMEVSILADGVVVGPELVTNGAVQLPFAATAIQVGLGFTAQFQTMYLDMQGPVTIQGRRKEIDNVVVRVVESATPFSVGANQPDASIQPGGVTVPWTGMTDVDIQFSQERPLQPFELFSGDIFANVVDQLGFDRGQVAIQQVNPVPLSILAVMPWVRLQDDPDV